MYIIDILFKHIQLIIMFHIILSLFTSGIFLTVIFIIFLIVGSIYIISHLSGMDPITITNILTKGMKDFIIYIIDCFEYLKHLF